MSQSGLLTESPGSLLSLSPWEAQLLGVCLLTTVLCQDRPPEASLWQRMLPQLLVLVWLMTQAQL